MAINNQRDLVRDLFLPTLLFAALGAMTWAVRGCSGFGGMQGCIFAGVGWGTAWWFMARDPAGAQSRRYASGWIILALTIGIGFSGARGWMQWPSFFEGRLQLNTDQGRFAPISHSYGFLWLFIAGVPWAGLGACLLAWCGPRVPARARDWALRFAFGIGAAVLARTLFEKLPQVFLPLYDTLRPEYANLGANPNLRRLINDSGAAMTHLGLFLGFLAYEAVRKDWKNALLISAVGLVNGVGWAALQNWKWAPRVWPEAHFNWWRCWESSAGISIGLAYGLAYFLVNQRRPARVLSQVAPAPDGSLKLERFAAYLGLLLGLGLSLRNGLKGWANIYVGNEDYWSAILWRVAGPLLLLGLLALALWNWSRPASKGFTADLFPRAHGLMWLVLITLNAIAQLITGPHSQWSETAFALYYVLLFLITALVVPYEQSLKLASVPTAPLPPCTVESRTSIIA